MADETGTPAGAQPPAQPTPPAQPEGERPRKDGIMDRVKRAKREGMNEILTKFGVPDVETLADLVTKGRTGSELENKFKTDLERLTGELTTAQKEAAELKAARIADRVDGTLNQLAVKLKAEHPEDVIEQIRKVFPAEVEKLVGADGKINETEAQRLVDEIKKARPGWFLTGGPGSPSNRGGRVPSGDAEARKRAAANNNKIIRG